MIHTDSANQMGTSYVGNRFLECRQVIAPEGVTVYRLPCNNLTSALAHLPRGTTVEYIVSLNSFGEQSESSCRNTDPQCYIPIRTADGLFGWIPSGLPTQPQQGRCGEAPGVAYVNCCPGQGCTGRVNKECRQVIAAEGVTVYPSPCNQQQPVSLPLRQGSLVDYIPSLGGHRQSSCRDTDLQCYIPISAANGIFGWIPSGLPTQPQQGRCGEAPGVAYVSCCPESRCAAFKVQRQTSYKAPPLYIKPDPCWKATPTAVAMRYPIGPCTEFSFYVGSTSRGDCTRYNVGVDCTMCWISVDYQPADTDITLSGWITIAETSPDDPLFGNICGAPVINAQGEEEVFIVTLDNPQCKNCSLNPEIACRECTTCDPSSGECVPSARGLKCGDGLICNGQGQCILDTAVLGTPCRGVLKPYGFCTYPRLCGTGRTIVSGYCPGRARGAADAVLCCADADAFVAGVPCQAEGVEGTCSLVEISGDLKCPVDSYVAKDANCPKLFDTATRQAKCCVSPLARPCTARSDCSACWRCGQDGVCEPDPDLDGQYDSRCGPDPGGDRKLICNAGTCLSVSLEDPSPCPPGYIPSGLCRYCIPEKVDNPLDYLYKVFQNGIVNLERGIARPDVMTVADLRMHDMFAHIAFMEYRRDYKKDGGSNSKYGEYMTRFGLDIVEEFQWVDGLCSTVQGELERCKIDIKGAILAIEGDILVTFRGSEGTLWTDYKNMNFKFGQYPFKVTPGDDLNTPLQVHSGQFLGVWSASQKLWGIVAKAAKENPNRKRVWFIGHSLGGANALMAAALFKTQLDALRADPTAQDIGEGIEELKSLVAAVPKVSVAGVVAFGAYQIGNFAFSRHYNNVLQLGDITIRWVQYYGGVRDLVTTTPGDNICEYTHVGHAWEIKQGTGDWQVVHKGVVDVVEFIPDMWDRAFGCSVLPQRRPISGTSDVAMNILVPVDARHFDEIIETVDEYKTLARSVYEAWDRTGTPSAFAHGLYVQGLRRSHEAAAKGSRSPPSILGSQDECLLTDVFPKAFEYNVYDTDCDVGSVKYQIGYLKHMEVCLSMVRNPVVTTCQCEIVKPSENCQMACDETFRVDDPPA